MSATPATYTPPPEIQGPSFHHALPVNPAALLLPRMEPKVRRELAEDIRSNGQQSPIVMLVDPQGSRSVLNGISRLEALELLGRQVIKNGGLNPEVVQFQEIDAADLRDPVSFVLSVNVFRRHLSSKDKRELAANLLRLYANKSDHQIAEMVGMSHHTVGAVRNELERCGQIAHVLKRIDATGKRSQPAKKPPPKESKESPLNAPVAPPEPLKVAADSASLKEIARLGREIRSLLTHPTSNNLEGIYKRVAQIIRLTGSETESRAFNRIVGHA
jgi:hypothetical protein